jgi:hypothetical protein
LGLWPRRCLPPTFSANCWSVIINTLSRSRSILPDSPPRLRIFARTPRNPLRHILRGSPNKSHMFIRFGVQGPLFQQRAPSQDHPQIIIQFVRQHATLGARMSSFHAPSFLLPAMSPQFSKIESHQRFVNSTEWLKYEHCITKHSVEIDSRVRPMRPALAVARLTPLFRRL